ncbi:microsomal triglyceride transfer protein large subunit isoform X2 [Venturia canescens]|nr:microsomal triglyceride transfer protein large subunit isoform X2 [Venturia canescens]XP_043281120.1 microsomal triglyceride transfer protein large subunit isoform X2 [Venturia canescens]
MAPAVVGATRGWNVGEALKYQLVSTILSREAGNPRAGGDVGFQLTSDLNVAAVWHDPKDPAVTLLQIQPGKPQLWIKSRRAPEPEGFVEHNSRLDDFSLKPIFGLWRNGQVTKIFLDPDESVSSKNLKRGLLALFQYRTLDGKYREYDTSGWCNVTYVSAGSNVLEKWKDHCDDTGLKAKDEHPNPILAVDLVSTRRTTYLLNPRLVPARVDEYEQHEATLKANKAIGTTVTSRRTLTEISSSNTDLKNLQAQTAQQAIAHLQPGYKEVSMDLQIEPVACPDSGCRTLKELIEENREALDEAALGTAKSASAFLKLIPAVREASVEELTKLLKSPKNSGIKTQFLDVLGSASTPVAHQAAMKVLRQDETGDETERYLWGLSMSPLPNPEIIKDVMKRSEETMQNEKVSETLALTAAAMARKNGVASVVEKVRSSLELGLESCSGEECRLKFLRALRNLGTKASIPILLDYAMGRTRSTSVAAWRALSVISRKHLTDEIRSAAARTFYQYGGPRRDSSARTLAVDIILENQPTVRELRGILEYLGSRDPMFEVRRYVSQRVEQLALEDSSFRKNLEEAAVAGVKKDRNWNVLAHRGLSTAFTRSFLNSTSSNGSLVTIQEVNSGLLKRGVVDVVMKTPEHEEALFSLGLFAGGLGSFVSSSSPEEDQSENPEEDEAATAGMEISLLGVGVRPFVFFSGQGELMGHVWSGTASEKTPAYQALANLHRHSEYVPLASGYLAELEVEGALSFNLGGHVQLSLWSRSAQSSVEMAAGIAVRGESRVRTEFVQSSAEFALTIEPKLELTTDLDFSGPISLCMRLGQPETNVRHNVYKIERIPGSRHRLRKTKRSVLLSPAKSYLLNRKNNEMCSKVHS